MNSAPLLYWVEEREAIRLRRLRGDPAPWTADPILLQYRFCNVRRRDDRVSQWLIQNVLEPFADHPNLWVMVALARYVNWTDTIAELMHLDLWPTQPEPYWRAIGDAIDARTARGEQSWTGAYMIRAESNPKATWYSYGKGRYVSEIVVQALWTDRENIVPCLATTVEEAHSAIAGRYGWGSFMTGQMVADLTYTRWLQEAPDLRTWAPLGRAPVEGSTVSPAGRWTRASPRPRPWRRCEACMVTYSWTWARSMMT